MYLQILLFRYDHIDVNHFKYNLILGHGTWGIAKFARFVVYDN